MVVCRGVNELLNRLGNKWAVQIVVVLQQEPLRFNQILRMVDGISQQMLTRTLKALIRDGIIKRNIKNDVSAKATYSLSPLGVSLSVPLKNLAEWAVAHQEEIKANHQTYDEQEYRPAESNKQ